MLGATSVFDGQLDGDVAGQSTWMVRGGAAAESRMRLTQLQAKIDRLEHQSDEQGRTIADLLGSAHQATRLHALADSLRNAREHKLNQVQRCAKDAKARIETLETRAARLETSSLRRQEATEQVLKALEQRLTSAERTTRVLAALFTGSFVILATMIATRIIAVTF